MFPLHCAMLRRNSAFIFVGARVYLPPSLGFPWILSSESRLINGLHGKKRGKFSLALFPDVGCTIRVSQVEATRKRQEYSCRKRNLVSGFLQDNILRAVRYPRPYPTATPSRCAAVRRLERRGCRQKGRPTASFLLGAFPVQMMRRSVALDPDVGHCLRAKLQRAVEDPSPVAGLAPCAARDQVNVTRPALDSPNLLVGADESDCRYECDSRDNPEVLTCFAWPPRFVCSIGGNRTGPLSPDLRAPLMSSETGGRVRALDPAPDRVRSNAIPSCSKTGFGCTRVRVALAPCRLVGAPV